MVVWVGEHILHRTEPVDTQFNGSGDTTYFYVLLFTTLLLTAIGTIIWSAIDYKRSSNKGLFYWLIVVFTLLRWFHANSLRSCKTS
jgi:cytochrome b subunit of formate dehydrogenase